MPKINGLPWSVTLLAFLYIALGLWSIGRFFLAFHFRNMEGDYGDFFIGLIQISVGAGLLERSRFWRFVLLAWIACKAAAAITVMAVGYLTGSPDATMTIGSQSEILWQYPTYSPLGIAVILSFLGLGLLWSGLQWWILDRPEARKLFIVPKSSVSSIGQPSPKTIQS